jgi:large-conductance mechanosensitive channel
VSRIAGRLLRSRRTSSWVKSVAASALKQRQAVCFKNGVELESLRRYHQYREEHKVSLKYARAEWEEKMNMRKIIKEILKWFALAICAGFIAAVINSAFARVDLWKSIKTVVGVVINTLFTQISAFIILAAALGFWVFHLHREVNKLRKEREEQKELELNAEHILILKALANELELVPEIELRKLYSEYYPDNEPKDLKFVINDLIKNKLIRHAASGPEGKEYSIESKGLDALRKATFRA